MQKVFYWCPFISKVATIRAVIKSAQSLKKYSNKKYEPTIINVAGEWNEFKKNNELDIKIVDLNNSLILDNRVWTGYVKSRLVYIYIFFISFFPLIKLIKNQKPDFFIIQLITSLPLFLNRIFNFKTKMILRISGIPKLNIIRKFYWKFTLKKINLITTPTKGTFDDLIQKNFDKKKLRILHDPIITPSEIIKKKKIELKEFEKDYFISIGRFTKQKNFKFLVKSIAPLIKINSEIKLYIFGDGEQKNEINDLILKLNLRNNIMLLPFQNNIYNYINNSRGLILSSLWEDPGFVLIEAAYLNTPILSSDCKNGPEEILDYGNNGILFENNNENSFREKFNIFHKLDQKKKQEYTLNAKKNVKKFSFFSHYKALSEILESI
jgi:glycosyltransferase involved in cell wall biosynthesis